MSSILKMTFAYDDDTTRQYVLNVDIDKATACKSKIRAVNTSLAGGTSGGLDEFFVSADGEYLKKISAAQIISETETVLDLGGE